MNSCQMVSSLDAKLDISFNRPDGIRDVDNAQVRQNRTSAFNSCGPECRPLLAGWPRSLHLTLMDATLPDKCMLSQFTKSSVCLEVYVDERRCWRTFYVRKNSKLNRAVFNDNIYVLVYPWSVIKIKVYEKNIVSCYVYGWGNTVLSDILNPDCPSVIKTLYLTLDIDKEPTHLLRPRTSASSEFNRAYLSLLLDGPYHVRCPTHSHIQISYYCPSHSSEIDMTFSHYGRVMNHALPFLDCDNQMTISSDSPDNDDEDEMRRRGHQRGSPAAAGSTTTSDSQESDSCGSERGSIWDYQVMSLMRLCSIADMNPGNSNLDKLLLCLHSSETTSSPRGDNDGSSMAPDHCNTWQRMSSDDGVYYLNHWNRTSQWHDPSTVPAISCISNLVISYHQSVTLADSRRRLQGCLSSTGCFGWLTDSIWRHFFPMRCPATQEASTVDHAIHSDSQCVQCNQVLPVMWDEYRNGLLADETVSVPGEQFAISCSGVPLPDTVPSPMTSWNASATRAEAVIESQQSRCKNTMHTFFHYLCSSNMMPGYLRFAIRRDDILNDTYQQLLSVPGYELRRKPYVVFINEEGIDYGGITREWFNLVSGKILDATHKLFVYDGFNSWGDLAPDRSLPEYIKTSPDDNRYLNVNMLYRLFGRIIGMALVHRQRIQSGLSLTFFKRIIMNASGWQSVKSKRLQSDRNSEMSRESYLAGIERKLPAIPEDNVIREKDSNKKGRNRMPSINQVAQTSRPCFSSAYLDDSEDRQNRGSYVLSDLKLVDECLYNSMLWIIETDLLRSDEVDVRDYINLFFIADRCMLMPKKANAIDPEDYEITTVAERLIENGEDIPVSEESKGCFINKMLDWRLNHRVLEATDAIMDGINDVIPVEWLLIMDCRQSSVSQKRKQLADDQSLKMDYLFGLSESNQYLDYTAAGETLLAELCGPATPIDTDDWRNNTVYVGYSKTSKQVSWFWRIVSSEFTERQRASLLQFTTGSARMPLGGFAKLSGYSGKHQPFCIQRATTYSASSYPFTRARFCRNHFKRNTGNENITCSRLPVAHTCFNRLELPAYKSYDIFKGKLMKALEETEGFHRD